MVMVTVLIGMWFVFDKPSNYWMGVMTDDGKHTLLFTKIFMIMFTMLISIFTTIFILVFSIHSYEHTDTHNADGWDDGEHDGWLGERPRGDDGGLGTGCGQQSGFCHDDGGGGDYDG